MAGIEEIGHLNDELKEGLEVNRTFASEKGFLVPGAIPNNLREWLSILLYLEVVFSYFSNLQFIHIHLLYGLRLHLK